MVEYIFFSITGYKINDKKFNGIEENQFFTGQNNSHRYRVSFYFKEEKKDVWKNGYVNDSGKLVIDCIYEKAEPFQNGYAVVTLNGQKGHINKKGEFFPD